MRGNDLDGKHDEWKFTRLNIVWVETIFDGIFYNQIIWVHIFRVVIILGGNCPVGSYSGWEFSWVGIFLVGIVRWKFS